MKGLHARAAAKFVKTVEQFDATIRVRKVCSSDDTACDPSAIAGGASILGLMMLGAECGSQVELMGEGEEANRALDALCNLIATKFGEPE
jgi:phosphocarrier protein HPr